MRYQLCVLCVALLFAGSASAAEPAEGSGSGEAHTRLSADPIWEALGHYQEGKSTVDGPLFFLSPVGKDSPASELAATISALANEAATGRPYEVLPQVPGHPHDPADDFVACRFPARVMFLLERQVLRPSEVAWLSKLNCPAFSGWFGRMAPASATFLFSSYHLKAPASAFGHTFLRIGQARGLDTTDRPELLQQAVDFSAEADSTNAITYAFNGMFGLFPGRFHAMPYYFKVREYNDFESRDLWEYELNLTTSQLNRLVAHLWELGPTWLDYWYVSENCSYQILALLQVAVPEANLLGSVRWPVVPADTVKAVLAAKGLVRSQRYRPSVRSQFLKKYAELSTHEREDCVALAADPAAQIRTDSPQRMAAVIDAALDLFDMRHFQDIVFDERSELTVHRNELLRARAGLRIRTLEEQVEAPPNARPELSHGSRRVGIAAGSDSNLGMFASFGARLAMHDLTDPPTGQPELGQLEFFPISLRLFPESGRVLLERADLVVAGSFLPLQPFSSPTSWRFKLGAVGGNAAGCYDCTAFRAGFDGGIAVGTSRHALTAWLMGASDLLAGPAFAWGGGAPVAVGLGGTSGLRVEVGQRFTFLTQARLLWRPEQEVDVDASADTTLRLLVADQTSIVAKGAASAVRGDWGMLDWSGSLGIDLYY